MPPPHLFAVSLCGITLRSPVLAAEGTFVRDKLPRLASLKTAVSPNVLGYSTENYVEVARVLEAGGSAPLMGTLKQ